jgi:Domain of Unknown Function (DUF1080)
VTNTTAATLLLLLGVCAAPGAQSDAPVPNADPLISLLRSAGVCRLDQECVPTPEKLKQVLGLAKMTEQWHPVPPSVSPGSGGAPPADAIILFDGSSLDAWVGADDHAPARWLLQEGVLVPNKAAGNIETKRRFRNYQLHVEWLIPKDITGSGQDRGNSGVFLASTGSGDTGYELQILDSWKNPTYVNGQAGSLYKQSPPLVNASRPPGEWQSYDVVWTAPWFNADGTVKTPAYATVFHNGVLVQNHTDLKGETVFVGTPAYHAYDRAPIKLQAHPDPSQPIGFRNIWVRELP